MDDLERPWNDLAAATSAAVEAFAAAEDVFLLFAAAVFALHQDTLRACAIDMARAGDPGQAAAFEAAQPTPLGGFSARIGLAMNALMAVERANSEILANPPDDDGSDIYRLEMLMARMRATAARLWLLTVQARAVGQGSGQGGAGLRLGVAGLWTRLQTVPREALPGRAPAFTGMYYDGIRCEALDYPAWPLTP